MNSQFKQVLLEIIRDDSEKLINNWIAYFNEEQKDDEYHHYDDFLGFFEECVEADLIQESDAALALKHFLKKLQEIIGDDAFFHFNNSVYTCFLKFPIFHELEDRDAFQYENVKILTSFFESLTSKLIIEIIQENRSFQELSMMELSEREASISEIWDHVLMVSIVGTLDSNRILQIINKVLAYLEKKEYTNVIIDISAIYDMNSEVANQIIKLNNSIHYMGVKPNITGITSNIAKSLTHLNINLGEVQTFATTKQAMHNILKI